MAIVTVGKQELVVECLHPHQKDRVILEVHENELDYRTTVKVVLTMNDGSKRVAEFRPRDLCKPPKK